MYIDELKEVQICKERKMSKESSLNTEEVWQLSNQTGQLNWTSSQKKTDMSFGACEVSMSIADAKISDPAKANNYFHKLKSEKVLLQFPNLVILHLQI